MWLMGMGTIVLLMLPPKPAPARPPQAAAAFGSAQVDIAQKRCDRAVERLAEAIAADATYWEAHKARGECLLQLERAGEAVAHFERWGALRPDDREVAPLLDRARSQAEAERRLQAPSASRGRKPAPGSERPPSLGELARKSGSPKAGTAGGAYVLTGDGSGGAGSEPIPEDAPSSLLDSMRQRAESIFRPRMAAVAPKVLEWRQLMRRYGDACHGKTTTEVSSFRSEGAFGDQWTASRTTRNEETPKCLEILSDIGGLRSEIVRAMSGVDEELRQPPSVYPGIREEVFYKLRSELW